ncbi:MAG: J domain-containing protein [Legionella sp.]|nr:J domain-containing protein [Legionella sp.]
MTNYYEVLGVEKKATTKAITKAYHKLALRHHPDKSGDDTKFKDIQAAYDVLGDPEKRRIYDCQQEDSGFYNQFNSQPTPMASEETYKESSKAGIHISSTEAIFLRYQAESTGLSLAYMAECFTTDDGRYSRIAQLLIYLKNHFNNKIPALTLDEVLATSVQESANLNTLYQCIQQGKLTIPEAKALSEIERMFIATNTNEKGWHNLQAYWRELKPAINPLATQQPAVAAPIDSFNPAIDRQAEKLIPQVIIHDRLPVVERLAEQTNLSLDYLRNCYRNKREDYSKIDRLSSYLKNLKNDVWPSLTLEEVLATTDQEQLNLITVYPLISSRKLAIDEAKKFTETERMILVMEGKDDIGLQKLRAYRAAPVTSDLPKQSVSPESLPSEPCPSDPMESKSPIVLDYKSKNIVICYAPNGTISIDSTGTYKLLKKTAQLSNTNWFDGPMMLSSFLLHALETSSQFKAVTQYKDETAALHLLEYCYKQFTEQLTVDKLILLCTCPDILGLNLPADFKTRLSLAIDSPMRRALFFNCLKIAIEEGTTKGLKSLLVIINELIYKSGETCLVELGFEDMASHINNTNFYLPEEDKHCELIQSLQHDKIVSWLYQFLNIQNCAAPQTDQELYILLEQAGPILAKGPLGIDSYKPNSAKCVSAFSNARILAWNKKDYLNTSHTLHATLIVGVKLDAANAESSRIYFLDPLQTLDPNSKNKDIYSVSYSKFMSNKPNLYVLSDYNLTETHRRRLEPQNLPKVSDLRQGFHNSFLSSTSKTENNAQVMSASCV